MSWSAIKAVAGTAILASLASLASCSNILGSDCADNGALAISGGSPPTFTFDAACDVLELQANGPGGAVWAIRATDGGSVRSPVHYGETPAGSAQTIAPTPLRVGEVYSVTLNGEGNNESLRSIGSRTFQH